jgi:hypothetical protein
LSLPKLSPRRADRIAADLALKASAAASRTGRPPSYGGGWGGTYLPGSGFGPEGSTRDYAREAGRVDLNPLVRLIIGWYANAVQKVSFRVGRQIKKGARKGEYEANLTHGLNRILRRPCPVFGFRDTFAQFIAGILIDGNAYAVIVEDNGGQPAELWWVPNWQVEVVAGDDPRRPIAEYRIHTIHGQPIPYRPENILHIRDLPDPRNPLIGLGRLKCFLPYLLAVQNAGEYTNEAFRKGNTGIVLMPPEGAGPAGYSHAEESEMLGHKRRLDRGLAAGGSTPIMYLTSYLVHEKIGLSPQEMSAETIVDRPESYILAAAGLPALIFGLPSAVSGSTFNNVAEANRAAWEDSAASLFEMMAEGVQNQVLYRVDPDTGEEEGRYGDGAGLEVWADTSEVPALQENATEKAEHWIALVDAGLVTREYAASQLDIPEEAIPEEEAFVPGGMDEEEGGGEGALASEGEDGDDPSDDDEDDEDTPATKAARGGGARRRRGKGGKPADRVPPNVSRAARRVAQGKGTSEDQKLLKAWGKRKEAGKEPLEAYLDRHESRELASHRAKLRSLDTDWRAKLDRYDAGVARKRSALESRVAGKPDADRKLAEFDRKAAEARPDRDDQAEFAIGRTADAFDTASYNYRLAREARAEVTRRRPADEAKVLEDSRRYGAEFVARNLPPSIRSDPDPLRFVPVESVAMDLYRERGGGFGTGRDAFTPDDPARYAATVDEVRRMWLDALAGRSGRDARRGG